MVEPIPPPLTSRKSVAGSEPSALRGPWAEAAPDSFTAGVGMPAFQLLRAETVEPPSLASAGPPTARLAASRALPVAK